MSSTSPVGRFSLIFPMVPVRQRKYELPFLSTEVVISCVRAPNGSGPLIDGNRPCFLPLLPRCPHRKWPCLPPCPVVIFCHRKDTSCSCLLHSSHSHVSLFDGYCPCLQPYSHNSPVDDYILPVFTTLQLYLIS